MRLKFFTVFGRRKYFGICLAEKCTDFEQRQEIKEAFELFDTVGSSGKKGNSCERVLNLFMVAELACLQVVVEFLKGTRRHGNWSKPSRGR